METGAESGPFDQPTMLRNFFVGEDVAGRSPRRFAIAPRQAPLWK
jgi:hypothetical protein